MGIFFPSLIDGLNTKTLVPDHDHHTGDMGVTTFRTPIDTCVDDGGGEICTALPTSPITMSPPPRSLRLFSFPPPPPPPPLGCLTMASNSTIGPVPSPPALPLVEGYS